MSEEIEEEEIHEEADERQPIGPDTKAFTIILVVVVSAVAGLLAAHQFKKEQETPKVGTIRQNEHGLWEITLPLSVTKCKTAKDENMKILVCGGE